MRVVLLDLFLLLVVVLMTALTWFEPWRINRGQEGIYWLSLVADDFTCFAGPAVLGIWLILMFRRLRRPGVLLWVGLELVFWMAVTLATLYLNVLDWSPDPRHVQSLPTKTHQYHLARFDDSIDGIAWLALDECDIAGIFCKCVQTFVIGVPNQPVASSMEIVGPDLIIYHGGTIVGTYALR